MRPISRTTAVAAAGVLALLAGCGGSAGRHTATASPGSGGAPSDAASGGAADGNAGAAASAGGVAGGTAAPGLTTAAPGGGQAAACPATAETLMAALRENAKLYSALAQPGAVRDPHCLNGYAVATTVPTAQVEPALVVYAFDGKVGIWRAVNAGTGGACEGQVPADIAARLPGC